MSEPWGDEWDVVADVVVVGSGAAGLAAAVAAATVRAEVVVIEKAPFPGGTTAKSGGVMWIADNPIMRERGLVDERDDALRYLARTAYPTCYDADHPTLGLPADRFHPLEAFYDGGAAAVEALMAAGALEIGAVDYPDYYAQLPEDAAPIGRVLAPVLPPTWRRGIDPTGGQYLVDGMQAALEKLGGAVLLAHEVVELVRDPDGRVIGVEARTGRRTVLIGARGGVVFGSGGFLHDEALAASFLRGPVFGGAAADTATGDFVRLGIKAGARLGNMSQAWWDQVVVEQAVRRRATSIDVYSPHGDSMFMVNRHGVRVVNEKAPYSERGQIHHAWDPSRLEYPNLLLFMIFDDAVVQREEGEVRFRWPIPRRDDDLPSYILKAPDLRALAEQLRDRLQALAPHTGGVALATGFDEALAATAARWNEMARAGRDIDFLRGESPVEQAWSAPRRDGAASGAMFPLAEAGPYYCVIVGPGALDTKGGPVTDEHGRVIDVDGDPIPGLYGAGNCVASPTGQAYWGPGGTIGPALTFGYIAGRHAAENGRLTGL